MTSRQHSHPLRRSIARRWPAPGWKSAGVLALLCSGVAWASFPRVVALPLDQQRQWQALGGAPLSHGGVNGMPVAPAHAAETVGFLAQRAAAPPSPTLAGPLQSPP